jgi:hypothetical protein
MRDSSAEFQSNPMSELGYLRRFKREVGMTASPP